MNRRLEHFERRRIVALRRGRFAEYARHLGQRLIQPVGLLQNSVALPIDSPAAQRHVQQIALVEPRMNSPPICRAATS